MKIKRLENKNIYYITTGASAADKSDTLVRELISEGANVYTLPTKASLDFINLKDLEKIKNNTLKLGWDQNIKLPKEDAILIAPCTFNTFNSIASGSADTYPLCVTASAIGKKIPVFLAPAMNKALWSHPIIEESLKKLEAWGCRIIWPDITEDKVSMMDIERIMDTLCFSFTRINFHEDKVYDVDLYKRLNKHRENYFESFKAVGSFLSKGNLNLPTAGCLSIKIPEGFIVTSSGSDISNLNKENLTMVTSWNKNKNKIKWTGDKLPSSESPLHCSIHDKRNVKYILHTHCQKLTYSQNLEKYALSRYIRYGSFYLGEEVLRKLKEHDFCIMKYHGEVFIGDNTEELIGKISAYCRKA